jgi:AcrR family transcriptional regulator
MLSSDRRQRQRDELRESIVATAIQLAAAGWAAVTMRAIGEHLGYTAAGLYHHFPSKDAVIEEINRRGHAMLLERFERVRDRSPRKALLAMAKAHVDMAFDHPQLYQAVAGIGVICDNDVPPPEAVKVIALLEDIILKLVPNRKMLPDAFELTWATLTGIVNLCMAGQIQGGRKRAHQLSALAVNQLVDSWTKRTRC